MAEDKETSKENKDQSATTEKNCSANTDAKFVSDTNVSDKREVYGTDNKANLRELYYKDGYMSTYITDYETSILNDTVKYDFRNGDYDSGVNEYLNEYTEMMDRVVSGKEPMSHEEKYMRIILSFMIFVIVAGMIGVLLTKLVQLFSGGDDDDDEYYGGGSSGDSSSGWSGSGFSGGGSTGSW